MDFLKMAFSNWTSDMKFTYESLTIQDVSRKCSNGSELRYSALGLSLKITLPKKEALNFWCFRHKRRAHLPSMFKFCGRAFGCGSSSSHIFPKLKPFNWSEIDSVPTIFTSDANVNGWLKLCRLSDWLKIKSSGMRIPDNVPPIVNDFLKCTLSEIGPFNLCVQLFNGTFSWEITKNGVLQQSRLLHWECVSNKLRQIEAVQVAIQLDIIIECDIGEILWNCENLENIDMNACMHLKTLFGCHLLVIRWTGAIPCRNANSVCH